MATAEFSKFAGICWISMPTWDPSHIIMQSSITSLLWLKSVGTEFLSTETERVLTNVPHLSEMIKKVLAENNRNVLSHMGGTSG